MTPRDPELSADDELQSLQYQVQVYEALAVAIGDARAVVDAMLEASNPEAARQALERRYGFTEMQARAVMELQFRRVTALDRQRIEQRRHELAARVAVLEEELGGA
jgi:DNA gyrase subunit A